MFADTAHRKYKLAKLYTPEGRFQEANAEGGPGRRYNLRKIYV